MTKLPACLTSLCLAVALAAPAGATTLKASHQFPGGKGDVRDEMVQIIAREVAKANVDLDIRVFLVPRCSSPRTSGTPWSAASSTLPPFRWTTPTASTRSSARR